MARPAALQICLALAIAGLTACGPAEDRESVDEQIRHAAETAERYPQEPHRVDPNAPAPVIDEADIPRPPDWGPPGRLDPERVPNPYVNRALSVQIARPAGWVWLPETCMPDFATRSEPIGNGPIAPEDWNDPIRTPLVAMASVPNPQWGRDAVALLYVRPFVGELFDAQAFLSQATRTVLNSSRSRSEQFSGYAVVGEPSPADVGGLAGASVRIRYDATTADGTTLPASEQIWHGVRGRFFFYFHVITPEAAGPEVQTAVEAIRDSLHLEERAPPP